MTRFISLSWETIFHHGKMLGTLQAWINVSKFMVISLILGNLFCLIKVIHYNYHKMWFKLCHGILFQTNEFIFQDIVSVCR